MITEILTLIEGANTVHDFFGRVTGLFKGSQDENSCYLNQINESLKNIDSKLKFERLSDDIIYTPLLESVRDITRTQQKIITDLRDVRESLEPVQRALGGEIISSAMIESPSKMQNALSRSPWEVLSDIRPAHLAAKPNNPDLVPIFFKYQGMYYIGWFMRGALIPSFDCEFSKLWTPDTRIILESDGITEEELKYLAEERLKIEQALRDTAKQRDEISRQARLAQEREKVRLAQEQLRREQEELENLKKQHSQTVQRPENQENGKNYVERINNVDLSMVYVKGDTFQMGSNDYDNEKPVHTVTVKPFYMGKYPVTQAQYQAVMGNNPSNFKGDNHPVEQVSWRDSVAFCKKLSGMTKKDYRLPTEAEWEYACRAGSEGKWCFGDSESLLEQYAWYNKRSTSPVGDLADKKRLPNAFGLYDMHGNVWEWTCSDYTSA
jgi:formylglycine-generating enzyme required for sulfatase activity